jgi:EAL domain-containing protein (putative c-di-GMP-specific phosphodiesterase class I)
MGVRISIDDFGMGFTCLNRLKEIPCDTLKIDGTFIGRMDASTPDTVIVSSIIAIGHGVGMQVLAEGVETRAQLSYLQENGCDAIQGFLLSPPVPGGEALALMQREATGQGLGAALLKEVRS